MQTELRARELMKMGLNVKIMLIGKKGATYFKRRSEIFNIAGVLQSLQGTAVGQLGVGSLPRAAEDSLAAERAAEPMGESCSGRLPTVGGNVSSA